METAGMAATGEVGRRREMKPWKNLAVKGGGSGGVLIVGGALIAAAVGAGTVVAARRGWKRHLFPAVGAGEKAEEIKDFDGEKCREKECQIDRETSTPENVSVSKNPDWVETKQSLVKTLGETGCVLPNESGEKEVRSIDQIEQTSGKSEYVFADGMVKEIEVDQNLTVQVLEKSELILVDEVGKEKEILPTESQLAVSEIALIDEVKEVEESMPSESEFGISCGQTEQSVVTSDNKEQTNAEIERILNSEFSKEDLQSVHVAAESVLSPTEEIKKEEEPGDGRTACIQDIAELVSTANQGISAGLVSAATAEVKNEESGSGITACVEEIAELVLAATKSIDRGDCHSVQISAELVLDDPEEIQNEENSSDQRTACVEEIAELLLAATEGINIEECRSNQERGELVLAAANEILKEEETGVSVGKLDEGIQSADLEFSIVEHQSHCIRDETVLAPTEEIKREQILLQKSKVEIAERKSETPEVSEINEQEEKEVSSVEIQEESKFQLQLGQEEKEILSTESEHDIEEKEDKPQLNTEDSQKNESAFATRKEIEKEDEEVSPSEHQLEMTEHQPQPIVKRIEFSIIKEIREITKEEIEASAEMREEVSESVRVSSAESNTQKVWVTEVIEQKKILPVVELKEQKESIMVKKFNPPDNSLNERVRKGANDILQTLEEIQEEQKRSIPAKREKTLKADGFFMAHDHSRLLMVLIGTALILGILCFFNSSHIAKLSSQLYQVIFPDEETQKIEL